MRQSETPNDRPASGRRTKRLLACALVLATGGLALAAGASAAFAGNDKPDAPAAARHEVRVSEGGTPVLTTSPAPLVMVSVPAGAFQRDADAADTSTVSAFSMSETEITRAQWTAVTGLPDPSRARYSTGAADPVQRTNWYAALVFCNRLSMREGLTPVYTIKGSTNPAVWGRVPTRASATWDAAKADWSAGGYRLPTEMEWMWAAMGATSGAGAHAAEVFTDGYLKAFAGDADPAAPGFAIGDYAWYGGNSGGATHPVGAKTANELGLHDMSGNVWEWCWDWWEYPDAYPSGALTDYRGAASGTYHVKRGGSWWGNASSCSVATRNGNYAFDQNSTVGFRVVRSSGASTLTVIAPNGGETWPLGSAQTIRWTSTGLAATSPVRIGLSRNGGATWSTLASSTPNDGTHAWTVSGPATTQARIRITSIASGKTGVADTSDGDFTLGRSASTLTMVSVPAGAFQRDGTSANASTVSAFSMSAKEITAEQFTAVTGLANPSSSFTGVLSGPVQMTNWYHALVFCNRLSLREGLTPVYAIDGGTDPDAWGAAPTSGNATWDAATADWSAGGYRLPTEMEWMWAAMGATAGTSGYLKPFAGSMGTNAIGDYAWYVDNAASTTHPVGTKTANELGLYDMSGNVWEWCWDWYAPYPDGAQTDYRGAAAGTERVNRGGSWDDPASKCPVAYRSGNGPYDRYNGSGFRVVRRP